MDAHLAKARHGSLNLWLPSAALAALIAALTPAAAQQVYMRRDADGKIQFSNAPTAPGYQNSETVSQPPSRIVTEKEEQPQSAPVAPRAPVASDEERLAAAKAQQKQDIQELIEGLQDPIPRTRWMAADQLGNMGGAAREAVPALLAAAKNVENEDGVRNWSFVALTKIAPDDPSVVQLAIRSLGEKEGTMSSNAINFLISRSRQVAPALLLALKSEDDQARASAAQLLGKQPVATDADLAKLVVPALVESLNDRSVLVRRNAARSLAAYKDAGEQTLAPLTAAVADRDNYVRGAAAQALAALGPQAAPAIPALSKALRDPDHEVRMEATKALQMIDTPQAQAELERYMREREVVKK